MSDTYIMLPPMARWLESGHVGYIDGVCKVHHKPTYTTLTQKIEQLEGMLKDNLSVRHSEEFKTLHARVSEQRKQLAFLNTSMGRILSDERDASSRKDKANRKACQQAEDLSFILAQALVEGNLGEDIIELADGHIKRMRKFRPRFRKKG